MSDISVSILGRLRNKSIREGIAFQQLLNLLFQEEFLRRLAQSEARDNLILKGGYLLYTISGFMTRPTIDADYLLRNQSNDLDAIESMVKSIIDVKTDYDDFMRIEIRSIMINQEMTEYHGIRVNLMGSIAKTKTPFSVDFGVGDIIFPSEYIRTIPVLLLGFEKPTVLTYSLESVVSEKLDAIIRFMEASGRMKDFYDIFYLANSFDFEGDKLKAAIQCTFSKRNTPHGIDTVLILERLILNDAINSRWENFCHRILKKELKFSFVVQTIISFLNPPLQSLIKDEAFSLIWNRSTRKYNIKI